MAQHPKFKWRKFAADLRQHRKAFGWGLREASRSTKIHHATFCRAEQGKPVTVPIYLFLCAWIGVDPKDYAIRLPE